jgi:hypothetical protein
VNVHIKLGVSLIANWRICNHFIALKSFFEKGGTTLLENLSTSRTSQTVIHLH